MQLVISFLYSALDLFVDVKVTDAHNGKNIQSWEIKVKAGWFFVFVHCVANQVVSYFKALYT